MLILRVASDLKAGSILLTSTHEVMRPETKGGDSALFAFPDMITSGDIQYNVHLELQALQRCRQECKTMMHFEPCWAFFSIVISRQEHPYCHTSDHTSAWSA